MDKTARLNYATNYFAECDLAMHQKLGYLYTVFFRNWIFDRVENWRDVDQFVVAFENDELLKVDVIKDRKIITSISREEWLDNKPNLDSKEFGLESPYTVEFLANETKFMKYIRFSNMVVPISNNYFIIPIPVAAE
jgi:hypothetical protein